MKTTQAQRDAVILYNQKQDNIMIRPSKDKGTLIRQAAAKEGKPIQRYILDRMIPIAMKTLGMEEEENP